MYWILYKLFGKSFFFFPAIFVVLVTLYFDLLVSLHALNGVIIWAFPVIWHCMQPFDSRFFILRCSVFYLIDMWHVATSELCCGSCMGTHSIFGLQCLVLVNMDKEYIVLFNVLVKIEIKKNIISNDNLLDPILQTRWPRQTVNISMAVQIWSNHVNLNKLSFKK